MTKKGVAEWVSIILCLLPSPFVIMFLLIVAGEIREAWHITNFLAVTLCAIVGLIALLFTSWVLNKIRTMRGCLTTIVFLLITSGLSTFMFGSAFFIAVLLDPDAPSIFELQWHTNVILLVYLIVFIKIIVKVSRMLSNSICDFLFGKEDEQ